MKTVTRFAAVLALALVWAGTARAETLKIGLLPIADTLLLHVAERNGYFNEEGLSVKLIPFQSFLEKNAAVQAGELDGHFGEVSAVIIQKAAGMPFVIIASTSHTSPEARMFGLVSSPKIKPAGLDDLKGRQLAISRLAIVDFLSDVFLESAQKPADLMIRKDIRKIPVRLQMLLAGQVDAALFPEPLLSVAENAGGTVLMDDRGLDMPLAVIALAESKATPETVDAFRKALVKAGQAINKEPDKYRTLLMELRLIPPNLAESYKMQPVDLDKIPHTLPSPALYQRYTDWLIKNGALLNDKSSSKAQALPRYEEVVWQGGKDERI